MANTPQARKRARQNTTRRMRNMSQRSTIRTQIKNFLEQVESNDPEAAKAAYRTAVSAIDRGAANNLYPDNRAARLKKRLNNRLRAISA